VRREDRATVVAVTGELDLASSPALDQELERVSRSDTELLILDLSELEFMDSTGLSVLIKANQRAQDAGKRFGVLKGSPQVQRLLSLTGVDERLTVADRLDQLLG
jgi:anti-anti-sigma factor